jgi:hypothetical protein
MENNQTTNQFFVCNDQLPYQDSISILFNPFINLATACNLQFYLYKKNGSYLNKNISKVDYSLFIGFDSISRLV